MFLCVGVLAVSGPGWEALPERKGVRRPSVSLENVFAMPSRLAAAWMNAARVEAVLRRKVKTCDVHTHSKNVRISKIIRICSCAENRSTHPVHMATCRFTIGERATLPEIRQVSGGARQRQTLPVSLEQNARQKIARQRFVCGICKKIVRSWSHFGRKPECSMMVRRCVYTFSAVLQAGVSPLAHFLQSRSLVRTHAVGGNGALAGSDVGTVGSLRLARLSLPKHVWNIPGVADSKHCNASRFARRPAFPSMFSMLSTDSTKRRFPTRC